MLELDDAEMSVDAPTSGPIGEERPESGPGG